MPTPDPTPEENPERIRPPGPESSSLHIDSSHIQASNLRPATRRRWRIIYRNRTSETLIRDNIEFVGDWVVFSNGSHPFAHKTDLRSFSSNHVFGVEEIDPVQHPDYQSPSDYQPPTPSSDYQS